MGGCGNRLKKRRRVGRFLGVLFFLVDTPQKVDVLKEIRLTAAAAAEHPDFRVPPLFLEVFDVFNNISLLSFRDKTGTHAHINTHTGNLTLQTISAV